MKERYVEVPGKGLYWKRGGLGPTHSDVTRALVNPLESVVLVQLVPLELKGIIFVFRRFRSWSCMTGSLYWHLSRLLMKLLGIDCRENPGLVKELEGITHL